MIITLRGRNPTKHIWELGQVGMSWNELGRVGTSWDKLGQVGTSWDDLGRLKRLGTTWDNLGWVGNQRNYIILNLKKPLVKEERRRI